MKKKLLSVMLVGALAISALTGCGSKETASDDSQKTGTTTEADSSSDAADTSDFDNSEMINVQSREDGSGTRGASKKEKAVIRGAVTMCIAVTAIAYLFMPNGAKEAAASDKAFYTGYILMHYIVPLMVILDYLLFFPKGLYKALHPLCWLILPYLYIAFTMICAKFGSKIFSAFGGSSRYPYPFLDTDLYGKNKVALIIVFITAAFLALGYLSFVIDRLLGKNGKKLK